MKHALFIRYASNAGLVIVALCLLQAMLVFMQSQNAIRDEQALKSILGTEQLLVNPYALSRTLSDLSATGFIKCVKLKNPNDQQPFLDLGFQGGCSVHPILLQGAPRSIHIEAINGSSWDVEYVSQNTDTFQLAAWILRAFVTVLVLLGANGFRRYRERQSFLRELERSRADSLQLASAQTAHDLGSPFSLLRILSQKSSLSQSEFELFKIAVSRSHQIFAKLQAGHVGTPARCEWKSLVQQIAKEKSALYPATPLDVILPRDSEVYSAGDDVELARILSNILNNAFEAAPDGRIEVRLSTARGSVELLVGDEGPGIPDDVAAKIFDRGFSTKRTGQGLGLFHAKQYLESIGGSIGFSRRAAAEGSEVRVRLPQA